MISLTKVMEAGSLFDTSTAAVESAHNYPPPHCSFWTFNNQECNTTVYLSIAVDA